MPSKTQKAQLIKRSRTLISKHKYTCKDLKRKNIKEKQLKEYGEEWMIPETPTHHGKPAI